MAHHMNATALTTAIELLNRGAYRAALIAFEQLWHSERSESLRALILLCNALHQLQIGLVTAPRRNLDTAIRLLEAKPQPISGLDLAIVLASVRAVHAAIPPDIESGTGQVEWSSVPHVQL